MYSSISWKIGGQQGEGIESAGELLAKTLNRQGYFLYGYRVFSSRIRGGHTNYNIRISDKPVASIADSIDILIAFDQETIDLCARELGVGGVIFADEKFEAKAPAGLDIALYPFPITELATAAGLPKMKNIVALGMTGALLGLPVEVWDEVLSEQFAEKGESVVAANSDALRRGWMHLRDRMEPLPGKFLLNQPDGKSRLFMIGNEALAFGALNAGVRFMAAYPITPASEIMEFMVEALPQVGGAMIQTEDEISACMMAMGANYGGARAFTASSGPGLSLMAESIGLAGMTETPLVVVDTQRGGPSTGLPTKHEQSDLLAMIHASHGEIPKIVVAPDSVEDAFYDMAEAFNLAEEYQCPVIVLSDLQLSLGKQTVEPLVREEIQIRRGNFDLTKTLPEIAGNQYFKRYQLTESGMSERTIPGMIFGAHHVTGLEHDETGRPAESVANRKAQMDKRLRKLKGVYRSVRLSVRLDALYPEMDLTIVGMGATRGAITEAVARLREEGLKVNQAHIRLLHPFPTGVVAPFIEAARKVVVVENNATGQLAQLIKQYIPCHGHLHSLLKYDGNPFRPADIVAGCKEVL
jgi:2-oxoglutarate ferredoxin oxidoreductase subunit alpha